MTTITITIEQYKAIRQLKQFATWYIDEHEGDGNAEQWLEDLNEVRRGESAIAAIDELLNKEQA